MTAVERLAVAVLGLLLGGALLLGATRTLRSRPAEGPPAPPPATFSLAPPREDPHALAFAQGAELRRGVDPLRPPGLPAGATIDPATGLLSGIDLGAETGVVALPWPRLSPADEATSARQLPDDLRALEGRTVALAGFLMPLYEIARIREFLLVGSHYACCFGKPPGLGGMLLVRLGSDEAALEPLVEPIRVRGTLRIREQRQGSSPTDPLLLLFEVEEARVAPLR